jgi:hypothetical protein
MKIKQATDQVTIALLVKRVADVHSEFTKLSKQQ